MPHVEQLLRFYHVRRCSVHGQYQINRLTVEVSTLPTILTRARQWQMPWWTLLRPPRCGTVATMALSKSTDVTPPLPAPGSVGSTSVNELSAPPRVTLPRNLSTTLRGLEDVDLETLQREVAAEIKRRRSAKPTEMVAEVPPAQAVSPAKVEAADVPTGKANLIRASYQAGMKPVAIARSLRISRSLVDRVLGSSEKPKK